MTTTEFLVGGLPFAHYLEARGSELNLRGDVEVWIGEQRAEVLRPSAEGLYVRLPSPLPVGRYALRVTGPEELVRAAALEVLDAWTDAAAGDVSLDVLHDAAPSDAGSADAVFDTGTPIDASSDASDAAVPDVASSPGFCEDEDLVACYEFESNGLDGSRSGYDLTLEEIAFADGIAGEALSLSGRSSVFVREAPALSVGEFTLEFWMRADSRPTHGRCGLVDKNGQYGVFLQTDGTVRCTAGVGVAVSTLPIEVGEWAHIACTIDGEVLRIHRNGTEDSMASVDDTTPGGRSAFHLGEDSPGGGDQFLGRIDGVRVWSSPRSDAELCAAAGAACGL